MSELGLLIMLLFWGGLGYGVYRWVNRERDPASSPGGGSKGGALVVENPRNGYRESHPAPWLWTLLFGPFYFVYKGVWSHAVISFVVAIFTVGLSWLVYPFFSKRILKKRYQQQGWKVVNS